MKSWVLIHLLYFLMALYKNRKESRGRWRPDPRVSMQVSRFTQQTTVSGQYLVNRWWVGLLLGQYLINRWWVGFQLTYFVVSGTPDCTDEQANFTWISYKNFLLPKYRLSLLKYWSKVSNFSWWFMALCVCVHLTTEWRYRFLDGEMEIMFKKV